MLSAEPVEAADGTGVERLALPVRRGVDPSRAPLARLGSTWLTPPAPSES